MDTTQMYNCVKTKKWNFRRRKKNDDMAVKKQDKKY